MRMSPALAVTGVLGLLALAPLSGDAVAAPARAGKARGPARPKVRQIRADVLCGTVVDGAIRTVIKGGRTPKIKLPLRCSIRMVDPSEPSHMGHIHTVRRPRGKGVKPITTIGLTDDFGSQSGPGKRDFTHVMSPGVPDATGEVPFERCEDFDIVATITEGEDVLFTRTLKVQQVCPTPRPLTAALVCTYTAQDGTVLRWPGNGEMQKPRLANPASKLSCQITAAKVPDDLGLIGTLKVGARVVSMPARWTPPKGDYVVTAAFSDADVRPCESVTVEGTLVDGEGDVRWRGARAIVQTCAP